MSDTEQHVVEQNMPKPTAANSAWLKDLSDMIRAKNIFFVPFFGAFLAFLVTKSQYIIDAGIVVQVEIAATFGMGIFYAYILSDVLWKLETARMLSGLATDPGLAALFVDEKNRKSLASLWLTIASMTQLERKLFKWTMYSLWVTTGTVLFNMFFVKYLVSLLPPHIVVHL